MKSLSRMTWMEAKLFLREPTGAFFTLVFPVMMLLIFGTIYSSQPATGQTSSDIGSLIPAFTAMVIGISGLMPITMTMALYRENGILRRLRTTPINPLAIMVAQVIVVFVMTCLGMALLLIVGVSLYHVSWTGNPLSMAAGFTLCCLSFFGLGFVLAGLMPTARTAQVVGMVLIYPMLLLSGAGWPRELMPPAMSRIAAFVPLSYVVNLLSGLWSGDAWGAHLLDIGVLCTMLVLGVLVSAKTFRWE